VRDGYIYFFSSHGAFEECEGTVWDWDWDLKRVPTAGGAAETLLTCPYCADFGSCVYCADVELAVGSTDVYTLWHSNADATAWIESVPTAGGPATKIVEGVDFGGGGLRTNDIYLYLSGGGAQVWQAPAGGGDAAAIVSAEELGFAGVSLTQVDATRVIYEAWATSTGDGPWELHLLDVGATGAGTTLYSGQLSGDPYVFSGEDLCFLLQPTIVCVDTGTGVARTVVDGPVEGDLIEPYSLVADDKAIYWYEETGSLKGAIYKLAK
jgi:hypothetical protein